MNRYDILDRIRTKVRAARDQVGYSGLHRHSVLTGRVVSLSTYRHICEGERSNFSLHTLFDAYENACDLDSSDV